MDLYTIQSDQINFASEVNYIALVPYWPKTKKIAVPFFNSMCSYTHFSNQINK